MSENTAKTTKITKKEMYENLKDIVRNSGAENEEDLIAFIDKQIVAIENKNVKAKERAAEKKAAGDELLEAIKTVLTDTYQTADDILGQITGDDLTKAKVVARLSKLVEAQIAEKDQVKVGERKVMGYRLKAK